MTSVDTLSGRSGPLVAESFGSAQPGAGPGASGPPAAASLATAPAARASGDRDPADRAAADRDTADRAAWAELVTAIAGCRRCAEPAAERASTVPGDWPAGARLLLVGEAPGAAEDQAGRPFVGRSGQLLDGLLGDAGLARSDVAVLNVLRCRPPANRAPRRAEVLACRPFLEAQVRLVDPRVVVLLGSTAVAWGLGPGARLTALRGRAWDVRSAAGEPDAVGPGEAAAAHVVARPPVTDPAEVPRLAPAAVLHGRTVLATYHPSAALRFGPKGAPRAALAADLAIAASLLPDRLAA